FDPFYTTRIGGTGLGLALAAMISRNHDAKWSVTNRPEGGAEFTLLLPLSRVLMTTAEQLEAILDNASTAEELQHAV
ncbi:MAG: ATP-binding protein, partial [Betaproteobacteria bacterium]